MDRPANDIDSEARTVGEVYLIDPATKKPYAAGVEALASLVEGTNTALGTANTTLTDLKTAAESTATINVAQDTSAIKNGATSLTPKYAMISASTSGDNTLVAAVTGKKIRVLAYNLMGAGAVNARFQTAVAGAYLTGAKTIAAAGGGISAAFNPVGWFETVAGDLLNLELSGAVAVGGELVYVEV